MRTVWRLGAEPAPLRIDQPCLVIEQPFCCPRHDCLREEQPRVPLANSRVVKAERSILISVRSVILESGVPNPYFWALGRTVCHCDAVPCYVIRRLKVASPAHSRPLKAKTRKSVRHIRDLQPQRDVHRLTANRRRSGAAEKQRTADRLAARQARSHWRLRMSPPCRATRRAVDGVLLASP